MAGCKQVVAAMSRKQVVQAMSRSWSEAGGGLKQVDDACQRGRKHPKRQIAPKEADSTQDDACQRGR